MADGVVTLSPFRIMRDFKNSLKIFFVLFRLRHFVAEKH